MRRLTRIGIDGRALRGFIEGSRTGVARYTWELCRQLDKVLPHCEFFIYSPVVIELPVTSGRWHLRTEPNGVFKKLKPVLWTRFRCGKLAAADAIDVFWAAGVFLPRLAPHIKTVMTVYDLTYLYAPTSMQLSHRMAFQLFFKRDILKADKLTTISCGTAEKIFSHFRRGVDAHIYPSVNPLAASLEPSDNGGLGQTPDVNKPFILTVGTLEPRKNISLLIQSLRYLKNAGYLKDYDLVVAGGTGWASNPSQYGTDSDNWLHFFGYVDEASLDSLYRRCSFFAFPSIYEGFGMPVLEARAHGALTVTTDSPELREAGGSETIYAAPTVESFSEALREAADRSAKQDVSGVLVWPTWRDGAERLASLLITGAD